jgi:hypothetical protein
LVINLRLNASEPVKPYKRASRGKTRIVPRKVVKMENWDFVTRFKNVPVYVKICRDKPWHLDEVEVVHNGLRVTEANVYVGVKGLPSIDDFIIILLHELGHIVDQASWGKERREEHDTLQFTRLLYGKTKQVVEEQINFEVVAWVYAIKASMENPLSSDRVGLLMAQCLAITFSKEHVAYLLETIQSTFKALMPKPSQTMDLSVALTVGGQG